MKPIRNALWTGALAALVGACALVADGAALPQEPKGKLPQLDSFQLVAVGQKLRRADSAPASHATSLTVDARNYVKERKIETQPDRLTLDLAGRCTNQRLESGRQLIVLEPSNGGAAVGVTLDSPVDLAAWMSDAPEARLDYEARTSVLGREATLALELASKGSLHLIQRHGGSPIELDLSADPIGLEAGPRVTQGGIEDASARPSNGFYHPVPVTIHADDGTRTSLWQGEGTRLVRDGAELGVFVLVSEVARPRGEAMHLAEGDPFVLELLVVRVP